MKPQDRIKILKKNTNKKQKELDCYIKETKERYGKEEHTWAYDEHYQSLCEEKVMAIEGLKKYRLALKDAKFTPLTGDSKTEKLHQEAKKDAEKHGGYY